MKFWSGVGSRETPENILDVMREFAFKMSQEGWVLRSGGAVGADTAFEEGATNSFADYTPEIYLPWRTFNNHGPSSPGVIVPSDFANWSEAQAIAASIHPAWDKCSPSVQTLHSRNIYAVMGIDLSTPSKFLICWAEVDKQGKPKGGTRTAWNIAYNMGIPCFNLHDIKTLERIKRYIQS